MAFHKAMDVYNSTLGFHRESQVKDLEKNQEELKSTIGRLETERTDLIGKVHVTHIHV